jgi:hypothetical protein
VAARPLHRAVLMPVEVEADRAFVDDQQRPYLVRMRGVSMVDKMRVEHLGDPGTPVATR